MKICIHTLLAVVLKEPVVLILLVAETIGIMAFNFSEVKPEALAAVMIIGIKASGSPRIKLSMSIPETTFELSVRVRS